MLMSYRSEAQSGSRGGAPGPLGGSPDNAEGGAMRTGRRDSRSFAADVEGGGVREPLMSSPTPSARSVSFLYAPAQGIAKAEEKAEPSNGDNVSSGALRAIVFGGINGLVGLPALIAFATIVFQVRSVV